MSDITDILTGRITLKRNTKYLLDGLTPAASLEVDRQPVQASRLEIKIDGATVVNGLVNVSGNINESFSFSDNDIQIGEQDFTSISGITISGIDGGSIWISAIDGMGQQINQQKAIKESMHVRFFLKPSKAGMFGVQMQKTGEEDIADYWMMAEPDADIELNDLVFVESGLAGLTKGKIEFIEKLYDFDGITLHTEAKIKNL